MTGLIAKDSKWAMVHFDKVNYEFLSHNKHETYRICNSANTFEEVNPLTVAGGYKRIQSPPAEVFLMIAWCCRDSAQTHTLK